MDEQIARNKRQQEKETNKDLHYKVTVEHIRVFLLQAYTQTR